MKQSPSRESDISFAVQKIRCVLRKLKVDYRFHKRPPPVPILRQIITVHGPFSFFKFHFHLVLPHMTKPSKFSLSHKFPHHNTIGNHHLPNTCYMSRPPIHIHLITRIIFGDEWRSLSSSLYSILLFSVTLSLLDPNTILNTLLSHTLGLFSYRRVRKQISHPYETKEKIFLYILIFIILGSKLEDKRQYKINGHKRLCASSQFFTSLTNHFNN